MSERDEGEVRFKERMSVSIFLCFCFLLLARGLAGCVLDFCLVNCLRIIINSLLVHCLARVFVFYLPFGWLTRAEIRDDS